MASASKSKTMPRGGRKGGTQFPHIELKQAIGFNKKFVSKTHTSPQPAQIILKGVFNNSGPVGKVRVSAMRQYGLLTGSPKAYEASELSKQIDAAPPNEVSDLHKKACLIPKLFKTLHDTFQADNVTKAKIRQQAANLKVHPDSLDECVDLFVKSVLFAGLAAEENGNFQFTHEQIQSKSDETDDADQEDSNGSKQDDDKTKLREQIEDLSKTTKAKAQVEIKIDPSMDPEKLDKLLGVLKKYGQI